MFETSIDDFILVLMCEVKNKTIIVKIPTYKIYEFIHKAKPIFKNKIKKCIILSK